MRTTPPGVALRCASPHPSRRLALGDLLARWQPREVRIDYGACGRSRGATIRFPDLGLVEDRTRWLAHARELLALVADNPSPAPLAGALFDFRRTTADCRLDLPALVLGFLNRWEEGLSPARDAHGRFPHEAGLAWQAGVLELPFVDLAARACEFARARLAGGDPAPAPPWDFALTFDVDSAGMFRPRALAGTVRRVLHEGGPLALPAFAATALEVLLGRRPDPHLDLDTLNDWLLAEDYRTIFFVQATRRHALDGYTLGREPALVRALRRLRASGHAIGLHPDYMTAGGDSTRIRRARSSVRRLAGGAVSHSRRHYLRSLGPGDGALEDEAGLSTDSTLGFGATVGFRAGTAFPFRPVDESAWIRRRCVQVPVHLMDTALRHGCGLDPGEALGRARTLMEAVRPTGGVLVGIWHPHNLEPLLWPGWSPLPREVLRSARRRGAALAPYPALVASHEPARWEC